MTAGVLGVKEGDRPVGAQRPLRVLSVYAAYAYYSGGGENHKIFPISRHLAARGHRPTIVGADYTSRRGMTLGSRDGVEEVGVGALVRYRQHAVCPEVRRFIADRLSDFDVVHIYGTYDHLGYAIGRACARRGIPYVVEPMGMFRPSSTNVLAKAAYHRLLGRPLFRDARWVIATAENERETLIADGIPRERVRLRRNGLDVDALQPRGPRGALRRRLGMRDEEALVGYLGRVAAVKRLDDLVRAFAQIRTPSRLVLMGPDDRDGSRERVDAAVAQLGLGDRVHYIGPVYGRDKVEALADLDVLALASRFENFGISAAEAVAVGTPVVVTEGCGIAPLVRDRAGLVVDAEIPALAAGIERILQDGALRARLREGCRSVAPLLTWDEPISSLLDIYHSLLEA